MDTSADLEGRIRALEEQVHRLNQTMVEDQLDDWKARIDQLEVQMRLGGMEARDEINPLVEQLRNGYLDARAQLDKATTTAGDAANAVMDGVRKAMKDLTTAFDRAIDKMRG